MPSRILTRIGTSTDRPTLTVGEFGLDIDSPYNLWIGAPSGNKLLGTQVSLSVTQTGSLGQYNVRDFGAKGDGTTNDKASIQSAVDFIATLGYGRLYFPTGTYLTNTEIQVPNGSIALFGDGPMSVIKMKSGGTLPVAFRINGIGDTSGTAHRISNVLVRDLYFDMNGANLTHPNLGYPWGAVWAENIDNLELRNLYVKNALDTGINVRQCRYVAVDNCVVDTVHFVASGNGFNFVGQGTQPLPRAAVGEFVTVTNCKVIGSAFTETDNADAFYVSGFGDGKILINNCTVRDFSQGVVTESGDAYGAEVIISNCLFSNCRLMGVGMSLSGFSSGNNPARKFSITNNMMIGGTNGTQAVGICPPDNSFSVSGNIIINHPFGIYYSDGHGSRCATMGGVIANNYIQLATNFNSVGISMQKYGLTGGVGTTFIENISIIGNNINGGDYTGTFNQNGISIGGRARNGIISNNLIAGISDSGINFYELNGTGPSGWDISHNKLTNIGNGSSSTSNSRGMNLVNSACVFSGINISGNSILDTRASAKMISGIVFAPTGTANGNWIQNNLINGHTSYGIRLYDGTAWVRNNVRGYSNGPDNSNET